MASDDMKDALSDWAEALEEQRTGEPNAASEQGGPLFDEGAKTFSQRAGDSAVSDINMVLDIPVQLSVELGRTKVPIKHILQLGQGSVVELDALAGEPMDVLVNGS